MKYFSWINFLLGLWLIVAPFVLHYSGLATPTWNSVIVGVIVAVLSIVRALERTAATPRIQQHGAH